MSFARFQIARVLALAVLAGASASSCVDESSMTSGLAEITPRVDANDTVQRGNFDGCVSGRAIDNRQIEITFEIPAGATKVTVYRDGIVAYSSANLNITSFIDSRLTEGQSYHYACESVIKGKPLLGQKELDVATIMVNAPLFTGIDDLAKVDGDPHSLIVSWLPASAASVPASYYLIYGNLGSTVDFTKPYREKLPANTFEKKITNLGPQLPYAFAVRACSAANKCDKNVKKYSVTLDPDPRQLPDTPGITKAELVNGQAVLMAPWSDSNGAVAKRHVFMKKGTGPFELVKTVDVSLVSEDYTNPPQSIKVPDPKITDYFVENTEYSFAILDVDPSRASDAPTQYFDEASAAKAGFTTGDLKPPTFAGLSSVEPGSPADQSILVKWLAIDHQPAVASGASHYLIYLTSSTAPTTMPTDPCVATTPVAEVAASGAKGSTLSHPISGLTQRTAYRVCVKARDLAGNISDTTLSKPITTRDITPPAFDKIQSLGFKDDAVQVGWNKSSSSDLKFYRLKISKNGGATLTLNPRSAVPTNIESTTIPKTEFAVQDGDTVTVTVDACDNASTEKDWQDLSFNSVDNCTTTDSASYSIPDSTPPAGFQGIDLPNTCSTINGQGTMKVQWIEPPTWNDYRGFKVYTEVNGVYTLQKVCACSGANCPDKITSCVVDGLDHYKTYKFHVAAYDAAIPVNETKLPIGTNLGSSCRTSDTTPPNNFNWGTGLTWQEAPDGMALSWTAAEDDQKDTDAKLYYEVWRKADSTFTDLSAGATTLPTDGVKITPDAYTSLSYFDPVAGLEQGKNYYYAVYAKDESGNVRLGGILSDNVPDREPPTVSEIQTNKSTTDPTLPWNLTWTMSDNATPSPILWVTVRLNKTTNLNDGTTFPTDTDVSNKIVSKRPASQLALQPETLGANGYGIDNQVGDENSETYYYYLVTVEDADGNKTSKQLLLLSDRLGPTPPATDPGWTISATKVTTDSVVASTSGSAAWVKGGTDATKTPVNSQKVLIYSSTEGLKCDGDPTEVAVNKDATSANIALSTDGTTYSYKIRSFDSAGNYTDSLCSPALRRDSTPPTLSYVTADVPDGVYKIDAVINLQMVFSEPVWVTKGAGDNDWPSLKLDLVDSDPAIAYTSGSGTNTLTFRYTTTSGDQADNLDYVPLINTPFSLNGATIKDAALHSATISLAAPGTEGSIGFGHSRKISAKGPGNPKIVIDPASGSDWVGNEYTRNSTVLLMLSAQGSPTEMKISNNGTCEGSVWQEYAAYVPTHPLAPYVNETATLSVKFRDAELNESLCVSDTIIQDGDPPVVRITGPDADSTHGAKAMTVTGDCTTGDPQVKLVNDGGTEVLADCTDGHFSGDIALYGGDGWTKIYAVQTDLAGNEGTDERRFYKDVTPPTVAITSPANNSYINLANDSTTFAIGGTCSEIGRTVVVKVDMNEAHSVVDGLCDGTNWSATFDSTWLSEGAHTLYAVLTDVAENETVSTGIAITRDVTRPTVAVAAPSPANANSASEVVFAVTLTGASSPNLGTSDFEYVTTGSPAPSCSKAVSNGTTPSPSVRLTSCLNNGTLKIRLPADKVSDAAGNKNLASEYSATVAIDNIKPVIAFSGPDADTQGLTGLTITGSCEKGIGVLVSGDATASPYTCATDDTFSIDISFTAGNGTKSITLTQTDAAGNVSDPASRNFVRTGPPDAVKSSVIAKAGSVAAGGTTSTITVAVKDDASMALVGKTVTLAAAKVPAGLNMTVTPASATSDSNGLATFTVSTPSATDLGSATFTVTAGGIELNDKPTIFFLSKTPAIELRASHANGARGPGSNVAPTTTTWADLAAGGNNTTLTGFSFGANTPWAGNGTVALSSNATGPHRFLLVSGRISSTVSLGTSMNSWTNFSMEAWIRRPGTSLQLLSNRDAGGKGLSIGEGTGYIRPQFGFAGASCPATSVLVANQWNHIAVSFDATNKTLKTFINGIEECSTPTGTAVFGGSAVAMTLGTDMSGNAWNGEVAELRLYNTPLVAADVAANLAATISRIETAPASAPTLTLTGRGSSFGLSWTGLASNALGVKIERSSTGIAGSFTEIATVSAPATSYVDNNGGNGLWGTYYYRVRAYNVAGTSAYSATASAETLFPAGLGTSTSPWELSTLAHLQRLQSNLATVTELQTGYYILKNNIDIGTVANWTPIGTSSGPFAGNFNGGGYQITNLKLTATAQYAGLFGYVSGPSTIENLGVTVSSLSGNSTGYIGALAGGTNGSGIVIRNITVAGPGTVTVTGASSLIGGVVGYISNATMSNIVSSITVNTTATSAGGIVGSFYNGTLTKSYSTGAVTGAGNTGGLVGNLGYGSVFDCYSLSPVTLSSGNYAGGAVGYTSYGSVQRTYSTGTVTGAGVKGGLIGYAGASVTVMGSMWDTQTSGLSTSSKGTGYTTAEMKDRTIYLNSDWDLMSTWYHVAGSYPVLQTGTPDPVDIPSLFGGGDGSSGAPYLVSTETHLRNLSYAVSIDSGARSAYYSLQGNIVLGAAQFPMIGSATKPFTGDFNGNNWTVSNVKITGTTDNVGFFSTLSGAAKVRDLTISTTGISGGQNVGGLVGSVTTSSVQISGTAVTGAGKISGTGSVGGLVGYLVGAVMNSYSTPTVENSGTQSGGLVGYLYGGSIQRSYSDSSVSGTGYVGGLVGRTYSGSVTDAYATGPVTGSSNYIGGAIGYVYGSATNIYSTGTVGITGSIKGGVIGYVSTGTVSGAFWDTQTSLFGTSAAGRGLPTADMKSATSFLNADWNLDSVWYVPPGSYPVFQWQQTRPPVVVADLFGGGDGTPGAPYQISTATHLSNMAYALQISAAARSASYILTAPIDLSTVANFPSIGSALFPFSGQFNGNLQQISNLRVFGNRDNVGLFGLIQTGASIRDLAVTVTSVDGGTFQNIGGLVGKTIGSGITISNVSVSGAGTVSGATSVGGLVGYNSGTIVSDSDAGVAVSGTNNYAGGLVGQNYGATVQRCFATGAVTGVNRVGGLIGYNYSSNVSDSYARGDVIGNGGNLVGGAIAYHSSGSISRLYSTGSVSGSSAQQGGLIGYAGTACSGCFWDTTTSSQGWSASGWGQTTAQMLTDIYTASGWDLATTWSFTPGSYPTLR